MCLYKVNLVTVLVLVVAHGEHCDSDETCLPNVAHMEDADSSSFMQLRYAQTSLMQDQYAQSTKVAHVFANLPFNFGNTISQAAMFKPGTSVSHVQSIMESWSRGGNYAWGGPASWDEVHRLTQPGGEVWGYFNPDLHAISTITKCPLYLTPPKYWPEDVAERYFGNKTVFGIIRDPFERLVAQFRGGMKDYGGFGGKACDVNNGVKEHLKKLKASGDMFQGGCTNIPQAEWFEGPYGIKAPIDNWRFPKSANEFFAKHGYPWYIPQQNVMHVIECNDHWSGEFDTETRDLVRELYSKDFDIICKSFGHCDFNQVNCLQGVHQMCPETLFDWDFEKGHYCPRPFFINHAQNTTRIWQECLSQPSLIETDSPALIAN